MTYQAYGVSLTDGQKKSIGTAVNVGRGVSLRLAFGQLSGPDQLMLTKSQINKIVKAKQTRRGVDVKLSKTQMSKQGGFFGSMLGRMMGMGQGGKVGGFGPFAGSMLAGLAAPVIGKMFGFGAGVRPAPRFAKGLQLPGTGRGLQLPGTRRGRGKKRGGFLWALPALMR